MAKTFEMTKWSPAKKSVKKPIKKTTKKKAPAKKAATKKVPVKKATASKGKTPVKSRKGSSPKVGGTKSNAKDLTVVGKTPGSTIVLGNG